MSHLLSTAVLLLGLGLVVIVLFLVRRTPVSGASAMKLLARLSLDHRRALYMVQIGDKILVLGAGEGGLTRIAELNAAELDLPETEAGWRALIPAAWVNPRVVAAKPSPANEGREA